MKNSIELLKTMITSGKEMHDSDEVATIKHLTICEGDLESLVQIVNKNQDSCRYFAQLSINLADMISGRESLK